MERLWAKKDGIKEGYYIKKTTVDSLDEIFIVDTLTRDKFIFENAHVKRCNSKYVFMDNQIPYLYSCVIKANSYLGLDINNPIDFSSKELTITLQHNVNTIKIKEDSRVIFGNKHTFKVVNINDYSYKGLLEVSLLADAFNPTTDKQVEIDGELYWIANYDAPPTPQPLGDEIIITPSDIVVKSINANGIDFTCKTYSDKVEVLDSYVFEIDSSKTTSPPEGYVFTVVDGDTFNIKSKTVNKKVVIKITSVNYPSLIVEKVVNLVKY
jgi:hypothetical protein